MPNLRAVDHRIRGQVHASSLGPELAGLATRQHGVVSRVQLFELGLGRRWVDGALASGRLFSPHRGAYAVGHRAVSRDGRLRAAVLAVGPGAVLSHRSAAELEMHPPDETAARRGDGPAGAETPPPNRDTG